jgi:dihydroorotase
MHAPKNVAIETIVQAITANPRKILNQPKVSIAVGLPAELTLFSTTANWKYDEQSNLSKSKNSPLLGNTLKGKVIATINKDQLIKNV